MYSDLDDVIESREKPLLVVAQDPWAAVSDDQARWQWAGLGEVDDPDTGFVIVVYY